MATHKHHIFPQKFRPWFKDRGIDIDQYTIELDSTEHLRGVHGRGLGDLPGRWNLRWAAWIISNPEASAAEISEFGQNMVDDFGLDDKPIVPYR